MRFNPSRLVPLGGSRFLVSPLGGRDLRWLIGSVLLMGTCWALLWSMRGYWNPVFFFGLWTGATVLVRTLQGDQPLPLRRQLRLMALSVPLWWWFEFANSFGQNWHYRGAISYSPVEYVLFASLAFSTVVPALDAAWALTFKVARPAASSIAPPLSVWYTAEAGLGLVAQGLVFAFPTFTYPLVWVAPFLVLDGLVGLAGGTNLMHEIRRREFRRVFAVALAGLGCGVFWELWNFWSVPKWTYTVPLLGFWKVFEMPLLGYLGYVPFAWSVYQAVQLARWAISLPGQKRATPRLR